MQFWRPGDARAPHNDESILFHRRADQFCNKQKRLELLFGLGEHRNIIVRGQIGSLLSTRVPTYLAEAGWSTNGKSIAVALQRQVAVLSTAVKVARERGLDEVDVGGEYVGYVIRSTVKRSSSTKIVYFSSDALLQTVLADPLLSSAAVVVITDFQERGITTDLLLGLLKGIQRVRSELRVVITTVALDVEDILSFLGRADSTIVDVPSALHPVKILHAKVPVENYLDAALDAIKDSFSEWNRSGRPQGANILAFVKGVEESEALCERVNSWYTQDVDVVSKRMRSNKQSSGSTLATVKGALLLAVPLHGSLGLSEQMSALRSSFDERCLKVVIATNIAETSVTVDGISTVIDCGLERTRVFSPATKTTIMSTVPICCSSAQLRASRAGLVGPGTCIRLYTKRFATLQMTVCKPPEVLRCELTEMVLALKTIGLLNVMSFDFITIPKEELIVDALERLYYLGSLTESGHLTSPTGVRMSVSRLSPRMMKSLMVGESYGVGRAIAAIAAMLEIKEVVFYAGRRLEKLMAPFAVAEGDILTLLNIWRRYVDSGRSGSWCSKHGINSSAMRKAERVFMEIVKSQKPWEKKATQRDAARKALGLSVEECICRSIAGGYFENAAMVEPDESYLVALSGRRTFIHSRSVLYKRMPKWVVYVDLTQRGDKSEMRDVTVVEPQWIVEYAPELFELTAVG